MSCEHVIYKCFGLRENIYSMQFKWFGKLMENGTFMKTIWGGIPPHDHKSTHYLLRHDKFLSVEEFKSKKKVYCY